MKKYNLEKDLINKIKKIVISRDLLKRGDSVLISVSGGPDSVFLTHALLYIKDKYRLKLSCFHLDHKTREGQSGKDAIFVKNFCTSLGLKLYKKEIDAYKWCRENKLTFQEGARILRINYLKSTAEKHGINKIATGHTADDSIETFFINLLRGSAMRGLCGIKPAEGLFVRPLIDCRKSQIIEYLDLKGISYCIDSTNLENIYFRNRIRNMLMPFINENISPGFEERLLATIEILRQEEQFLDYLAKSFLFKEGEFESKEDKITAASIKLHELSLYPDAFKKRVIISAIEIIKGDAADIKHRSLDEIVKFLFCGGENKRAKLAGDIWVKKELDILRIYIETTQMKKSLQKKQEQMRYQIEPGSTAQIEELNIRVFSQILEREKLYAHLKKKDALSSEGIPEGKDRKEGPKLKKNNYINGSIVKLLKENTDTCCEAYLDFDKIIPPVYIGVWKEKSGQGFIPLGMKKFKKLHDFFIDEKIPAGKRAEIPIFFDKEKIIWVGKMRIDERVKADEKTKKILYIKIFDI